MNIDDLAFVPFRSKGSTKNFYQTPSVTVDSITFSSFEDELSFSQRRSLLLVSGGLVEFDGDQWFNDDKALSRGVAAFEWLLEEDFICLTDRSVSLTDLGVEVVGNLRKKNNV